VQPVFVRRGQQPAAPEMQQVLRGLPSDTHEPNVHYALDYNHFDVNHHDHEHDVHYRESWHVHRLFPVRRPELVWMHPMPGRAGVQVQRQGSLDEGVRGPLCGAQRRPFQHGCRHHRLIGWASFFPLSLSLSLLLSLSLSLSLSLLYPDLQRALIASKPSFKREPFSLPHSRQNCAAA